MAGKLIGSKKIDATIIIEEKSYSGKYEIFIATHFRKRPAGFTSDGAQQCWDVGSRNTTNGEVIRRHYFNQQEALAFWEEFKTAMLQPPESEERDEEDKIIIK